MFEIDFQTGQTFFRFKLDFQILKLYLRFQINSNGFSRERSFGYQKPYFILDGTHYVPHRRTDLNSFKSADAIICSAYKFFGPHIGVMAFKG
jgi:hypothetical protein